MARHALTRRRAEASSAIHLRGRAWRCAALGLGTTGPAAAVSSLCPPGKDPRPGSVTTGGTSWGRAVTCSDSLQELRIPEAETFCRSEHPSGCFNRSYF